MSQTSAPAQHNDHGTDSSDEVLALRCACSLSQSLLRYELASVEEYLQDAASDDAVATGLLDPLLRMLPNSVKGLDTLAVSHAVNGPGSRGPSSGGAVTPGAISNAPSEFSWFDDEGGLFAPKKVWKPHAPQPSSPKKKGARRGSTLTQKAKASAPCPTRHRRPPLSAAPRSPTNAAARPRYIRRGGKKSAITLEGHARHTASLFSRALRKGIAIRAENLSAVRDSSRTSTGWSGSLPPKAARDELRSRWERQEMNELLRGFAFIPCDVKAQVPTCLLDEEDHLILVRTSPAEWLATRADELWQAVTDLLGGTLDSKSERSRCSKNARGSYMDLLIGHHRQYEKVAALTKWHKENQAAVDKFLNTEIVKALIKWANSLLELYFPAVALRYQTCSDWHSQHMGFEALFGYFFNFCLNIPFPEQDRIHCAPHADWKNVVGICMVIVYLMPGAQFCHEHYSWLVIWEAGGCIQLPPWVAVLYPSSLFFHFNVDPKDIRVVSTNSPVPPTPSTCTDITNCSHAGRGSIVLFNQASLFQSSETNSSTLAQARAAGRSGKADFEATTRVSYASGFSRQG